MSGCYKIHRKDRRHKQDGIVRRPRTLIFVIPAKAGIQSFQLFTKTLDPFSSEVTTCDEPIKQGQAKIHESTSGHNED